MIAVSLRRGTVIAAVRALWAGAVHAQPIVLAPTFNAERLSTLPRDEWITRPV